MSTFYADSASINNLVITGSLSISGSLNSTTGLYIDNLVTVGLTGSSVGYNVIKTAVNSITDASANNTYTVRVYPGTYIEDTITVPSYVAIKGDSSISTIVSASNPSQSIFIMSDQTMVSDMQIQGSVAPSASAIIYSSPTTPQTNAIAYVENVRFGTNYTNAKVVGTGSNGNCILQCTNVKYGGFTQDNKSFDIGFHVTRTGSSGVGRMQLRNVTSTNGGVTGSSDQIFALADSPNCAFIVNGCLLTRATGTAAGTGFKVYNGGSLRLTGVNFQRWDKGIWAPQTGSGPSIDAIALNFENCNTDVLIQHTGSTGKVQGTDTFLKTQISLSSSLYEVGQDPRRITVGTKGADFTSISASAAYITDSSDSNRYVIEVGPGRYFEKEIDLTGKPYVSIVGSSIQTTQIFPSSSNQNLIKMGVNNEISFLSLTNSPVGYSALYIDDVGDYAQAHKVSFYDCDTCITVISRTQDTKFYGEYLDFNGAYSTGSFVSSSNGFQALASLENYYQFPVGATGLIANYAVGSAAELDIYAGGLIGESDATSVAVQLENGADMQGLGMDMPGWGTAVYIPNTTNSSSFNIVGSMIHDCVNYDFNILHPNASCRFQGTADHGKINNASSNFFWTFLDENDGELDITRNLAVTFADGTHTDASTLIFECSPMGVMQGGTITISGSLTITTAAGYGYLNNTGTNVYQRIDWNNSNLTLSPNTDNYIYLDETATLSAATTQPSSINNIILGRVVTNNTGVELVDNSPYFASHMSNALSKFNRNALGPVFADGCIVSEDVTPLKLDVSAGLYYFGENEYDPTGGSAITYTQYYQSGSGAFGWNKSSTSTVLSNVYNSGSVLTAMSASYYTKHSLYTVGTGPDEEYFLVIGQNQYSTLVETENANLPTPPTYFSDGVVALASVYVRSGSANIIQIQDIRPIIGFRAAGVNASSVHGNLLGLTADDHQQYLLVNGTRAMGGGLNMGGFDITNAASISASSFTGSLQGTATTASYVQNAQSASYVQNAQTASYVVTAQTASYVATAQTASYVLNAVSASYGATSSYSLTLGATIGQNAAGTIQLRNSAGTAISSLGVSTITASLAYTASYVVTALTASYVQNAQTASYVQNAITASYVLNAVSSSFASTASYVQNAQTASYVQNAQTASYVLQAVSASFASNGGVTQIVAGTNVTISPIGGTGAVTINSTGGTGASFPYTGSAVITGSLIVTGSTVSTLGFTGSLFGTASYASQALSASYAPYTTGNLATAQIRRTSSYSLPLVPALISFSATDVENQPSIIAHDNANPERIYVYSDGLYSIHYHGDVAQGTTTNDFEFVLTKNTLTILSGSLIAGKNSSTDKMTVGITSQEILAAGDYVSLAARYVASSGGVVNNAVLSVTKMEGVAGPQGPSGSAGAPGGVTQIVAGTNVTISPTNGLGTVTINAAGGSGTPGGTTGEVQYNNAGSFAGATNVEIASGNLQLVSTTDPAAPNAGNLVVYSKDIAGRQLPKWIGPSGVDTPFQPNMAFNQVSIIGPGGGTTVGVIGCTVTNVGTISNPNIATTNLKTQTRRIVNTSAAGAGSLASTRVASLECWRGNTAGQGGFFSVARFGFTTLQVGQRMFIGLDSNATAAPTNIDYLTSTATAKIGMYATGSTGTWSLIHNTAAAVPTVISLGANYPIDTTSLLEMVLFAKPNDTVVTYRITNLSTNAQTSGTLSTNLPASTAPLGRLMAGCNNATAAAMAWDVSRFSMETDY